MTSPSDTDQHPDVEEISDLTEGLLPPSRTAELRQHLDACALCADVHQSLMEIRDLLGTLPGPSPMPADVAERIDAALAAEALLDASPTADAPVGHQTCLPTPASVRSDARSRDEEDKEQGDDAETATEVTETVRSVDGTHVSRETSRSSRAPGGPSRTSTGPDRGTRGPGRGRTARRRRGALAFGTALGVAVLGMGVFLFQGTDTKTGVGSADRAPSPRVTAATSAADDFSGTELETRVGTLLAAKPGSTPTPIRTSAAIPRIPVPRPISR